MWGKMCADKAKCGAWALTGLRVVVGLILLYHGYPKLFGDEATKAGLQAFFASTVLPAPSAMLLLAGVLEVVGGILLVIGAWTKWVTQILTIQFLVIVLFVKLKVGWGAMELDLLILAALQVLCSHGAGTMCVEEMMDKSKGVQPAKM